MPQTVSGLRRLFFPYSLYGKNSEVGKVILPKVEQGSALPQGVLSFAKENGVEQVNLEVRSDNKRAIALYEKLGFRKLCTFPGFFKINGEAIDFDLMNLTFAPAAQTEKADDSLPN